MLPRSPVVQRECCRRGVGPISIFSNVAGLDVAESRSSDHSSLRPVAGDARARAKSAPRFSKDLLLPRAYASLPAPVSISRARPNRRDKGKSNMRLAVDRGRRCRASKHPARNRRSECFCESGAPAGIRKEKVGTRKQNFAIAAARLNFRGATELQSRLAVARFLFGCVSPNKSRIARSTLR